MLVSVSVSSGGGLTFHFKALHGLIQPVGRPEKNVDMPDEPLCDNHAVDVSSIAHVQQHVRYAGGRGFLEGGEDAPYAVDLLFHLLLLFPDLFARLLIIRGRFFICDIAGGGQSHIPELVNHVTLGMPMLVLPVAKDLDKLLKYCRVTSIALLGELSRVVIVAVNLGIVLVVAVLGAEDC